MKFAHLSDVHLGFQKHESLQNIEQQVFEKILDLDNTLWKGIVGEDGIFGIQIGETYPGNCFTYFQKVLKSLTKMGISLAICSKNDENIVKDLFNKRNDMILKYDDFISKKINWINKSENILDISKEIGLDETLASKFLNFLLYPLELFQ